MPVALSDDIDKNEARLWRGTSETLARSQQLTIKETGGSGITFGTPMIKTASTTTELYHQTVPTCTILHQAAPSEPSTLYLSHVMYINQV
jgi:hypothetical protein